MPLDAHISEIIRTARTIAVVGASPKSYRPSNGVARYLMEQGYEVIPINPKHDMILGVRAHPDLVAAREVEGPIDIVDIFRATQHVLPHVQEAIEITTKLIWMQVGVVNKEASLLAEAAGIPVMMDRCLRVAHADVKRQRRP